MNYFALVTWSSLGSIGRSPISKLSILMPFIGYIILLQDKFINLLPPPTVDGSSVDPKLSIGFFLLYFGLFVFGLGSFLFHIACPVVVKKFNSADEYVERIHAFVTASDLKPKLSAIIEYAGNESAVGKEAYLYLSSISASGIQPQQAIMIFTLRAYFELRDQSNLLARFFVLILFALGLILTTIPSLIALAKICKGFARYYL